MDFEAALVVDEVNHLLESLGVGVIKEEPLDPWFAQLGAEVWAGNRKEESVAPKLLPEELCRGIFLLWHKQGSDGGQYSQFYNIGWNSDTS